MLSKTCKAIGYVVFCLSFILGVYYVFAAMGYGLLLMFAVWIGGFFQGIMFLALGEILQRLDDLETSNFEISSKLNRIEAAGKQAAKYVYQQNAVTDRQERPLTATPSVQYEQDQWICKKCGYKNEKVALFCKDCGTYR